MKNTAANTSNLPSEWAQLLGVRRAALLRRLMRKSGLPPEVLIDLALEILDLASRKLAPSPISSLCPRRPQAPQSLRWEWLQNHFVRAHRESWIRQFHNGSFWDYCPVFWQQFASSPCPFPDQYPS